MYSFDTGSTMSVIRRGNDDGFDDEGLRIPSFEVDHDEEVIEADPTNGRIHPILVEFADFLYELRPYEEHMGNILSCMYGKPDSNGSYPGYAVETARRIIACRGTCMGWRDFVHITRRICNICVRKVSEAYDAKLESGEPILDEDQPEIYSYASYVGAFLQKYSSEYTMCRSSQRDYYAILNVLPEVICTDGDTKSRTIYRFTVNRWVTCGEGTIKKLLLDHAHCDYVKQLGLDVKTVPPIQDFLNMAVVPGLANMLNKQNVLGTRTQVYCRTTHCIRRGIPGDLVTQRLGYDPVSAAEYQAKIGKMLDVFDQWFGDRETTLYHLRCLSQALTGRFHLRWANVLFGTGSDGKSTILRIVCFVGGEYVCIAASGLYNKQTYDPDAATPGFVYTVDKLIVIVPDMGKQFNLGGTVFMQQTGGDMGYIRDLYKGGGNMDNKPLILMACDKLEGPRELPHYARVKLTRMRGKKRATVHDLAVMPAHLKKKFVKGQPDYADTFVQEYGGVLLTYLLTYIKHMTSYTDIPISERIYKDTANWCRSNPVAPFCTHYLVKLSEQELAEAQAKEEERKTSGRDWSSAEANSLLQPSVNVIYQVWRLHVHRTRMSIHGLTDDTTFTASLNLFETIEIRTVDGNPEYYLPLCKLVLSEEEIACLSDNGNMLMLGYGMSVSNGQDAFGYPSPYQRIGAGGGGGGYYAGPPQYALPQYGQAAIAGIPYGQSAGM